MADRIEHAWAAGFFDGEGSIGAYTDKRDGSVLLRMSVTQSSDCADSPPPALARFKAAVGGVGALYPREASHIGTKPIWVWHAQSLGDVRSAAAVLLPHLSVKADDVFAALATRTEYEGLLADRRRFCAAGHEYTADNTYERIRDGGGITRICRTCNRQAMRRSRARRAS